MHPFLTPELACLHEMDLRRDRAATRGAAPKRRRRLAPLAALMLLIARAA